MLALTKHRTSDVLRKRLQQLEARSPVQRAPGDHTRGIRCGNRQRRQRLLHRRAVAHQALDAFSDEAETLAGIGLAGDEPAQHEVLVHSRGDLVDAARARKAVGTPDKDVGLFLEMLEQGRALLDEGREGVWRQTRQLGAVFRLGKHPHQLRAQRAPTLGHVVGGDDAVAVSARGTQRFVGVSDLRQRDLVAVGGVDDLENGEGGGLQGGGSGGQGVEGEHRRAAVDAALALKHRRHPVHGRLQLVDAQSAVAVGIEHVEEARIADKARQRRRRRHPLGFRNRHRPFEFGEGVDADVGAATEVAIDDGHGTP